MPELFVPGRLCLFGEHADWAAGYRATHQDLAPGYCLVSGTDQGLWAEAEARQDVFEIFSILPDGTQRGPEAIPAEPQSLLHAARAGRFFNYAAGVAAEVTARYGVGGLRLRITAADLPLQKGLAPSAAICVLVARAYNHAYGLGCSWHDEMELAYEGERHAGSACGRMDQICALGKRPAFLTFDGPTMHIQPIDPGGTFWILVVDLRREKDTRRILADLHRCFRDAPGPLAARVRDALGPRNASLVAAARDAVMEGDPSTLGSLMSEAQEVFDRFVAPACPEELAAPHLHAALSHPAARALAWGGKGVGSQGDGCGQLVAKSAETRDALAEALTRDLGVATLPHTLRPPEDGTVPGVQD